MNRAPENKTGLSTNRQALLDLLFQEEALAEASARKIPRRQSEKASRLSFAQQRLWFLDQWEPGSSAYNISSAVRLTGRLNVAALEQSLNEILRRHEALRTTFATVDGVAVQVIAGPRAYSLPVVSLQHLAETEREAEAWRLVSDERSKPFDLIKGPLFRPSLLKLSEEEHILLLTMHHIVSDGWSTGVLQHELSVLYQAFIHGQSSPLADLPIQYADYAVWQREWLQGEVLEKQLSYWRSQLEGMPAVINLPTDRPRPAVQSFRGNTQSIELSKKLTDELKSLSRKEGVTLFMTLLAAFQTLLGRYTGQGDIVVGSPIANRNRSEIEGLIGFFANTLVLRSNLSGDPPFRELLRAVRKTALDGYEHQDLPFEKLVEELQPERSLSYSPLFQVMFVLQNAPSTSLVFEKLRVSPLRVGAETAKFDLLLSLHEKVEGLRGSLQYNTDLFDDATITRMLGHFETLLKGIVREPERRISDFPILTVTERRQLLVEWNETKKEYSADKCIHELFEEQVKRCPDAIAVVFEDQQLSYRELNIQANRLAHYLQKLGVGPEVLVGICVERSVDMIIGLLGILKAGGAYVPLDPEYPKERLTFMLEDTQARVLLTQERITGNLPEHGDYRVYLDTDWEAISQESEDNLETEVTSENLVYVSYTSGSTGRPKGVAMSQRSLCNLLSWQVRSFAYPIPARTLQFASLSFDVSFQEMFATWCSGGTLVLIPEELRRDAVGLLRYLQDQSVERLLLPFAALQHLAQADDQEGAAPMGLHEIITAGEQLQITQPIVSFFNKLKECKLHNQYGPSETHVVTAFTLTGPPVNWPALPSIGRPIDNTQIYLLDTHLQPVSIAVPGELYIGGDCVALGYLNRPDLTAEKFVPNPFGNTEGARLYKTGDLARYLPDGNIEFLGRIDNQVKIRGFRIELGEIEAVLGGHPFVRESVVLAREDSPGNKRLVAYVVCSQDPVCTVSELRSFLKEKLPEYMVPSAFVFLDSLPLTPNGKLDQKALPAPDPNRPELEQSFVAPRTPIEEILAEIWSEVVKLQKVGIHDNFFDLGGHSLLATQVVSRLRDRFKIAVPLRRIFETPTVAGLAEWVEREKNSGSAADLPNLVAVPRTTRSFNLSSKS